MEGGLIYKPQLQLLYCFGLSIRIKRAIGTVILERIIKNRLIQSKGNLAISFIPKAVIMYLY